MKGTAPEGERRIAGIGPGNVKQFELVGERGRLDWCPRCQWRDYPPLTKGGVSRSPRTAALASLPGPSRGITPVSP